MKTKYPENSQKQEYGSDPLAVRDTAHYQSEYIKGFVDKWDELISWGDRAKSEGSFFIDILKEHGAKRILDVASGTGFHSVRLRQAGFDVVSADGSPEMLTKAFENARRHGIVLRTVQADWRWLNRDIHQKFDAIICLGNSFTHLFEERDRRKTLAEFYAALRHDGILILDQRNYDSILDQGFSSKHIYYYCGENVKAEPEHVDEGLARFRYEFPDQSVYHLNMFPLRRQYTRRLMHEVGFQRIKTYGDFQETYHEHDPDFFVHVAEKSYDSTPQYAMANYSTTVNTARDYYNNKNADNFYANLWGGEDIHVGLYKSDEEPVFDASRRTVETIAEQLNINENTRILDIGAGYGGAARYLAKTYGCYVACLNLSEVQNQRNRELNREQGLSDKIDVIDGSFEDIPLEDESFDIVWSQDSILHSGNRIRVFLEVNRVLKEGGDFIFTDPMQSDDCPDGVLQPIYDRIHLDSLGSFGFYRKTAQLHGFSEVKIMDFTEQLVNHYSRILKSIEDNEAAAIEVSGEDYINRMKTGLNHWVEGGKNGYLAWGIMHFRKQ
ncbi:methyltransferase domain-containing protein [Spirulina sp. CS-785/01]|uniref:glycine/sarcosine N-methyltransferase n=1 Tax=Spirulina sp. CS-785/01 TaxID=3021716 RepID=UPI00232BB34B|nr:class I SAM-dependent methyltransferase [Spirulina sp. CS-785/01]MDB9312851.1 methyltransferase domain-containing protein [Spirulina sp. CS-785/01]